MLVMQQLSVLHPLLVRFSRKTSNNSPLLLHFQKRNLVETMANGKSSRETSFFPKILSAGIGLGINIRQLSFLSQSLYVHRPPTPQLRLLLENPFYTSSELLDRTYLSHSFHKYFHIANYKFSILSSIQLGINNLFKS